MKQQIDEEQIVAALLIKAETQGYVIVDDILELLPDLEEGNDPVDHIVTLLNEAGVQVQDLSNEDEEDGDLYFLDDEEEDEEETDDIAGVSADDSIGLYLREMARVPLLSNSEEIKLARKIDHAARVKARIDSANDDLKPGENIHFAQVLEDGRLAREHLIKANTRLVVSIAKKYMGRGVPFLDLIQEGNLGLMKAVEKYNHKLGFRFSTYATWWIRQTITRAIADQARTIRVPVHMSDRIRRLYKTSHEMEQMLGRKPNPDELAKELGVELDKVEWMLQVSWRPLSLEQPVGEEEDNEFGAFIEDETTPTPTQTVYEGMLRDKIEQVLSTLTPREQRILRLRFGLVNGKSYTLEEVGQKFGLTRERIRQIEGRALRRLRHPRRSRQLKDFLK
jgi:RNA polymerase primary sigma factor